MVMNEGRILICQVIVLLIFAVRCILCLKRKISPKHLIMKYFFYAYFVGLLSITILDFRLQPYNHTDVNLRYIMNLIPFQYVIESIKNIGSAYSGDVFFHLSLLAKNVFGNLIVFVPFGFFYYILKDKSKGILKVAGIGFMVSLSIEVIQLVQTYFGYNHRVFDIDDLILNTLGVVIGYFITKKLHKVVTKQKDVKKVA